MSSTPRAGLPECAAVRGQSHDGANLRFGHRRERLDGRSGIGRRLAMNIAARSPPTCPAFSDAPPGLLTPCDPFTSPRGTVPRRSIPTRCFR